MNERIRELAEQAGEYVNEVYSPPVRSKTPEKIWEDGHIDWHTQFNQKFAELIVADCVAVMREKTNYNKHVYTTYDQGLSSGVIETLVETLSRRYNINLTKPLE
jgi:hypothetical protein